jgi:threonine aldolase
MMHNIVDLRSDTVTWPTEKMRQAMAQATVGDDVYGDDPTVRELETYSASLLGMEAALFVASGTMGNQLAIMAQTHRGDEVILSERCHIVWHEAGAAALLSGVQLRCLPVSAGKMNLTTLEQTIRKTPEDIHSPKTALICLENADSDGYVHEIAYMAAIKKIAAQYGVPVHLDGARLFNAATTLGVDPRELTACVDTCMVCLSKGLCAPFGSILAGPRNVIEIARRRRKILGGGLRQAGIMAAAGLIALHEMTGRLHEDHDNATWLFNQLSHLPQWFHLEQTPQINMVFFRLDQYPLPAVKLVDELAHRQILVNEPDNGVFRVVTHHWVTRADLERFLAVIAELAVSEPELAD